MCGHEETWLGEHLHQEHGLSLEEYQETHPGAPVAEENLIRRVYAEKLQTERGHPPNPADLTAEIAGVWCPVNVEVPASACLPLPEHYRVPQHGDLAKDVRAASIHLKNRRSTFIWGPQGTGKDGFVHAYSALTRTPADKFQVVPGKDLQPWFWVREVSPERGTYFREGRLLKLARDGYQIPSGKRVPALILITDLDRATKSQAEAFRLLLDTIEARVPRWDGGSWPLFPGTLFVATSNTAGQGDETGRYASTNILDSTILARFERFRKFHLMDWSDEEPILRAKFPFFAEKMPEVLKGTRERGSKNMTTGFGVATQTLRRAIRDGDLHAEFSHRELCNWIQAAEDLLREHPRRKPAEDLLREASRAVFDKFPDEETRLQAKRLIHGFIPGGMLPPAEAAGVRPEDLPM